MSYNVESSIINMDACTQDNFDQLDVSKILNKFLILKRNNYPKDEIAFINEHPELFEEIFINLIKETTQFIKNQLNSDNSGFLDDRLFLALFSLGKYRSKKAFVFILELVQVMYTIHNDVNENDFLGDLLTEELPNILASCYDKNFVEIQNFIMDHDVESYARSALIEVLTLLINLEEISVPQVQNYIVNIINDFASLPLENNKYEETQNLIQFLILELAHFSIEEVDNILKKHPSIIENHSLFFFSLEHELSYFREQYKKLKKPLYQIKKDDHIKKMNNLHQNGLLMAEKWLGSRNEQEEDDDDLEEFDRNFFESIKTTTQIVRGGPKVGRNDSCPCNSGKKYKKCCLNSSNILLNKEQMTS